MNDQQPWIVLYRTKRLDPTEPHLIFTCMARDGEDAVKQLFDLEARAAGRNHLEIVRKVAGPECAEIVSECIRTPPARRTAAMVEQVGREFAKLLAMPFEPGLDSKSMDAIAALLDGKEWNADTTSAIAEIVITTGRTVRDTDDVEDDDGGDES